MTILLMDNNDLEILSNNSKKTNDNEIISAASSNNSTESDYDVKLDEAVVKPKIKLLQKRIKEVKLSAPTPIIKESIIESVKELVVEHVKESIKDDNATESKKINNDSDSDSDSDSDMDEIEAEKKIEITNKKIKALKDLEERLLLSKGKIQKKTRY